MAGTMSYYKAFKVNNRIVHSIEKFEGFNSDSQLEIEIFLGSMSYKSGGKRCAETYKGMTLVHEGVTYSYCIYIIQACFKFSYKPYKLGRFSKRIY